MIRIRGNCNNSEYDGDQNPPEQNHQDYDEDDCYDKAKDKGYL